MHDSEQVCPVSSREMHERGVGLESIGAAEPLLPGRDLPGQQSGMGMLLGAARPFAVSTATRTVTVLRVYRHAELMGNRRALSRWAAVGLVILLTSDNELPTAAESPRAVGDSDYERVVFLRPQDRPR